MHKNVSNKVNPGWIRLTLSIVLIGGFIIGFPALNAAAEAWHSPEDLALDSQGNFYVSDSLMIQIKKLNPQGEAVAVLGEQIRDEDRHAWYDVLDSIRVDSQGAIYAVGIKQPYIQKLGSQGQFEKAIDTGGRQPIRLRIDSQDHLWLLFYDAPYIEEYDEAGHKLDSWSLPGQLEKVHNFELDQQGNFYILANDQVYKVDSQHKLLATWPTNHESMREIALDNQGFIYLPDSHHIYKYDNQGKPVTGWNVPEKSFTFLSALAVGRDNTLYMLGEQDNQTVILRFDKDGRPISQWNLSFPGWISFIFRLGMYPFFLIVFLVMQLIWQKRSQVKSTDTEPLPAWVQSGIADPQLLYDHLDLQNSFKLQNSFFDKSPRTIAGVLTGLVAAISAFSLFMKATFNTIYGYSLTFDTPQLLLMLVIIIAGAACWWFSQPLLKKLQVEKQEQEALIRQVQGTFPLSNRSLFIGSARIPFINEKNSSQRSSLAFYLVLLLFSLAFSYLGLGNTLFKAWPFWLIESSVVLTIIGLSLFIIWALNHFQKEGPGQVRLNRLEMWDLMKPILLALATSIAATTLFVLLGLWLNPPSEPNLISFFLLFMLFFPLRYILIFRLILQPIPGRWLGQPLKRGDYEGARRRIVYWRRWVNTLSMRMRHAYILRRAGRLEEAEYVLQEILAKAQYHNSRYLDRILAALGLLRMYQKRYAEAIFLLENSLKLNPLSNTNYDNLGEVYLWFNHRPDRALELFQRATLSAKNQTKPATTPDLLINLAWAQAQIGHWPDAERNLTEAFKKLKSDDPSFKASMYLRAGLVMQLKGDYLTAMENYRQATTLDTMGYYGQKAGEYLAYNQAMLPTVPQNTLQG